MRKIVLYSLLLLIGVATTSCFMTNENAKIRRKIAKRKLRKARALAPELFKPDTIVVRDTIVVQAVKYDTVTTIIKHDSIIVVNNERMKLKYFYDTLRQEIHHEFECKEITKVVEKPLIVEKFKELPERGDVKILIVSFLCLVIILLIIFLVKRIFFE